MAAAAKHLTPVTLELGGKSPAILDSLSPSELEVPYPSPTNIRIYIYIYICLNNLLTNWSSGEGEILIS